MKVSNFDQSMKIFIYFFMIDFTIFSNANKDEEFPRAKGLKKLAIRICYFFVYIFFYSMGLMVMNRDKRNASKMVLNTKQVTKT